MGAGGDGKKRNRARDTESQRDAADQSILLADLTLIKDGRSIAVGGWMGEAVAPSVHRRQVCVRAGGSQGARLCAVSAERDESLLAAFSARMLANRRNGDKQPRRSWRPKRAYQGVIVFESTPRIGRRTIGNPEESVKKPGTDRLARVHRYHRASAILVAREIMVPLMRRIEKPAFSRAATRWAPVMRDSGSCRNGCAEFPQLQILFRRAFDFQANLSPRNALGDAGGATELGYGRQVLRNQGYVVASTSRSITTSN